MKKQLLSLGALATVAAPVVAVVSCGNPKVNPEVAKIKDEYTSKKIKEQMGTILKDNEKLFKAGEEISWSNLDNFFGIGEEPAFKEALGVYKVKEVNTTEGTITIEAEVKTKADDAKDQKSLGMKTFVIKPAAKTEVKTTDTNNTGSGSSTTGGNTGSGSSTTGGNTGSGSSTTGGNTGSGSSTTGGNTGSGSSTTQPAKPAP